MTVSELLAGVDARLRPLAVRWLPCWLTTYSYANGRKRFLKILAKELPDLPSPPPTAARTYWGLTFQSSIFNAAGMFKDGSGWQTMARQGGGAFLAGSVSLKPRSGNKKLGIWHPFTPYPRSHAALNWMGLPNPGLDAIISKLQAQNHPRNCPLGVSVVPSAGLESEDEVTDMAETIIRLVDHGVDFFEVNVSCPNTAQRLDLNSTLAPRLESLKDAISQRSGGDIKQPLIVKLSTDTNPIQIPELIDLLVKFNYSGINLGNTSTNYITHSTAIDPAELPLYLWYTNTFGGGLSGRPLKDASLELTTAAAKYLRMNPPKHEFHIIRTGGIENPKDLEDSLGAGASLVQWFTGYFEAFCQRGHHLYLPFWDLFKQ